MPKRMIGVDTTTWLFPDEVQAAYLADVQQKVIDAVADIDDVATAVASKVAPLTADGQVSPLLNSATSTRNALDNRYVIQAPAPSGGDDYAVLQALLNTGRHVRIRGDYLISAGLSNTHGNSLIGESFNTTSIKATATMTVMYTAVQPVAGITIADVTFKCDGKAQTAINTNWTYTTIAPSVNNVYSNIRINGYTGTGWTATSNNDCYFENILIEHSGNNVALDLRASGGALTLHLCRIDNPINIACQQATIIGGYYRGIRIFGADYNLISIFGSYLYADPDNNFNIYINSGAITKAGLLVSGAHIENSYSYASIIGGAGTMWGYSKFDTCQFEAPSATGVTLIGPGLSSSTAAAHVVVAGGLTDGVAISSASSPVAVNAINVNNAGANYINI